MTKCRINNPDDCFGPCTCGEREYDAQERDDPNNGLPEPRHTPPMPRTSMSSRELAARTARGEQWRIVDGVERDNDVNHS